MSCFEWKLSIHDQKCPEKSLKFKLSTNKDTYETDSIIVLLQIIEQDSK